MSSETTLGLFDVTLSNLRIENPITVCFFINRLFSNYKKPLCTSMSQEKEEEQVEEVEKRRPSSSTEDNSSTVCIVDFLLLCFPLFSFLFCFSFTFFFLSFSSRPLICVSSCQHSTTQAVNLIRQQLKKLKNDSCCLLLPELQNAFCGVLSICLNEITKHSCALMF